MRCEYRRLISLNLVLLMLLTTVSPLFVPAAQAAGEDYIIDGQSYTGDAAGAGWTYENNTLSLSGYTGGPILFSGPLTTVKVQGKCTVTATEGPGISADLIQIIFLPGSSLRVQGGSGSPALEAVKSWMSIRLPGELTAISGSSDVPALKASANIKIGDISGKINGTVTLEAGTGENALSSVAAYGNQPCVHAVCDQVTLHFNPGGGTIEGTDGEVVTKVVPYGTLTDFLPAVSRDGYYLRSWSANSHSYYPKNSFLPEDLEVTFTANWTALPDGDYVLFVNGYYGTTTRTFQSDGTVSIPSTFTLDSKTFLGWSAEPDDSPGERVTDLYWPGEKAADLASGTTLYAVYGDGRYYVTYAGNGGTERSSGGSRVAVRSGTLPDVSDLFVWEGHRPLEWNEKADGSGTAFQGGDSLTESMSRTLYAQWLTLYDRTVVYHGNGGTTSSGEAVLSVSAGEATLEDQGFQLTGKVLEGWSLSPGGEVITDLPELASGEALELYAVWGGYTVTCYGTTWVPYQLEEKTYVMAVRQGDAIELPHQYNDASRNLYFNGWNTKEDGSGDWYRGDSDGPYNIVSSYCEEYYTFVPQGDVTLYAQYIDLSGSSDALLFVTEGYYDGQNFQRVPTDGGALTLPEALEGYTLLGWTDNRDFGHYEGPAWLAGGTAESAARTVFLAVCEEQTFTRNWINHYVLYNGNGGAGSDGAETVFLTATDTDLVDFGRPLYSLEDTSSNYLSGCPLARDGYTLAGWNTEPDGTGIAYDLGASFSAYYRPGVYGYVFYAQWTPGANAVIAVPDEMRKGGKVFLACYSKSGQLLGTYTNPVDGFFRLSAGFPAGTAYYRLFHLDSGGAPLSACTDKLVP